MHSNFRAHGLGIVKLVERVYFLQNERVIFLGWKSKFKSWQIVYISKVARKAAHLLWLLHSSLIRRFLFFIEEYYVTGMKEVGPYMTSLVNNIHMHAVCLRNLDLQEGHPRPYSLATMVCRFCWKRGRTFLLTSCHPNKKPAVIFCFF